MTETTLVPEPLTLVLIFVALVLAGVVVRIVRGGKHRRRSAFHVAMVVMGVVLVVVVLGGTGGYLLLRARSVEFTQQHASHSLRDQREVGFAPAGVEAVVVDDEKARFLADVYPSAEQAAEALVTHVAQSLKGTASHDATHEIQLTGSAPEGVRQAVVAELGRRFPGCRVVGVSRAQTAASLPSGRSQIICSVEAPGGEKGAVRASLESPGGRKQASAQFIRKKWAAQFTAFVNESGYQNWILARSGAACTSAAEARRDALHSAATQLLPQVRASMQRLIASRSLRAGVIPDSRELLHRIKVTLQDGTFVQDRFLQCFSRPYGKLWRESLLINADEGPVARVSHSVAQHRATRTVRARRSWLTKAGSMAALGLLIVVVYLLLNAATKGYYVWSLRILGGGLLAAGTIVILNFA